MNWIFVKDGSEAVHKPAPVWAVLPSFTRHSAIHCEAACSGTDTDRAGHTRRISLSVSAVYVSNCGSGQQEDSHNRMWLG